MRKIMFRKEANAGVRMLFIVQFLTSNKIMSLEEAANGICKSFHLGEDIIFEIPDELVAAFVSHLESLECKYEQVPNE